MQKHLLLLAGLVICMASAVATADDKDLLKHGSAPPNLMIVFGNSQTTAATMSNLDPNATSTWDGDADSPAAKLGAAKQVVKQFVNVRHTLFNIGLTTFAHNPNAGSITLSGKHWLYSPLTVDFPGDTFEEPVGTIERWGPQGEGPCTSITVPGCTDRSPSLINLPSGATVVGPFFGSTGTGTAFIYLDGTASSAKKRIMVTLTAGKYGDAFTDGTLSTYRILGTHSMEVTKVYQVKTGSSWDAPGSNKTPNNNPASVIVSYRPPSTLTSDPELFYTTKAGSITSPCVAGDPDCGNEVGFLNDPATDFVVKANCSGWEFQANSAPLPLIKVPRDYCTASITSAVTCDPTSTCAAPQDSFPCVSRLMRPQAKLVAYDQTSGAFTTTDPDNPGYTPAGGSKYADGCDPNLLGAVDAGLDITENQAILTTRNGSQAPIKDLLTNIYEYFTKPAMDGFANGKRTDDPNKACRKSGVILIYDNFNGCQNDKCSNLTSFILTKFKQIDVPIYVIGFGVSAAATSDTGKCIAHNSGAILKDGKDGYFPVTDTKGLMQALIDISDILDESSQTFATAAVSTSQALGDQMAYFASFSASKQRSIWNGRLAGYKLDASGGLQLGSFTINDPNDPNVGATIPVPSNDPTSLIWNAGANLIQTPGTGATVSSAILAPGAGISTGSYSDDSNDTVSTIGTTFYPGRKIVFSLPKAIPSPLANLPIPAAAAVPETRYDMTVDTGASWWPTLKALLGPQTAPPAVLSPALDDTDAGNSLRFIWGDRDAVTGATDLSRKYLGQKLGDIFHSGPLVVGNPNDVASFQTNACARQVDGTCRSGSEYQTFFNSYKNRRRVLYVGANDGLLHAFEAGVWDRTPSVCPGGHCYDLGTGVELFAFAPRAIMQIYKPLKDAVGAQTKQDEWTVDLSPSAADVFVDASHPGLPVPANRAWHTVLVGGAREGSPFEGTDGASPKNSLGSYFALDITQPDELVSVGGPEATGSSTAPKCLNSSGHATCARDWPAVLWEITDTDDADANGAPDMGETWSKPGMGRVKVCTANCGTSSAVTEDHYVAIFGGGFDRERLNAACAPTCNRRGNWLYMVDIETGKTLYKVNSGTADFGSGSVTVNFGSIPSGPTALDVDGDGYLDLIYVGDLKGQLWRIDLTDLRGPSWLPPPSARFSNQLTLTPVDPAQPNAQGMPFLFFQAPQPVSPATIPFYPIYFRPEALNLGYNVGGRPALGIEFGTGDRDDILATVDHSSLTQKQRFYYIIDKANTTTTTESTPGLQDIASPTDVTHPALAKGWFLELIAGERVVGDSLTVGGIIRFPTYNPLPATGGTGACGNVVKCSGAAGVSRQYKVFYTTGDPYPIGSTDRGETQSNAMFITAETGFVASDGGAGGLFWSGGVGGGPLGVGRSITVRSWKEKTTSRP